MDELDVRFLLATATAGMWAATVTGAASAASAIIEAARWKHEMSLTQATFEHQQREFELLLSLPKSIK